MFKALLISVVIVPVLLGILAATSRRRQRHGLPRLLGFVLAYDMLYVLLLYFLHRRWAG